MTGSLEVRTMSNKDNGLCLVCNEQQIEPDPLHSSVCPNCGLVAIDEDAKKIIIFDDMMRYHIVQAYRGFGTKTYRFVPHACKSCKSVFVSWESETKVNVPVIIFCLMLSFWTVAAILGCVFVGLGGSADLGVATIAISAIVAFLMGCGIATRTEDGKDLGPEVLKDYILDCEMEEIQEALNPKAKKSKDVHNAPTVVPQYRPYIDAGFNPLATMNMQAPFPITADCVQARRDSIEAAFGGCDYILWR